MITLGVQHPGEEALRYYEHDSSRGKHAVLHILGGQFKGHVVSDFYCGYKGYAGKHQRCSMHLLSDMPALKQAHACQVAAGNVPGSYTWL
jgi:hypothetical protein